MDDNTFFQKKKMSRAQKILNSPFSPSAYCAAAAAATVDWSLSFKEIDLGSFYPKKEANIWFLVWNGQRSFTAS